MHTLGSQWHVNVRLLMSRLTNRRVVSSVFSHVTRFGTEPIGGPVYHTTLPLFASLHHTSFPHHAQPTTLSPLPQPRKKNGRNEDNPSYGHSPLRSITSVFWEKMPILTISTNVARSLVTAEMMKSACAMFATSINKPVEKALVQFNMDQLLCLNSSVEPCANLRLCSIGHLGESENIALAGDVSLKLKYFGSNFCDWRLWRGSKKTWT